MASYTGVTLLVVLLGLLPYGGAKCSPLTTDGTTVITCGRAYFIFMFGVVMPVDCKVPVNQGTTATYTCPAGYKILQEYTKISCLKTGQWGKSPPTCTTFGARPPSTVAANGTTVVAGAGVTTLAPIVGGGNGASVPFGYRLTTGIGNVKIYTTTLPYSGAKFACRVDGGDLLYFKTDPQRVALAKLLMNTPGITSSYFYVGAEDANLTGTFTAADGSAAAPVLWCPGEPSNIPSGGCMVYMHNYADGSGCMRNTACKLPQSFICLIPG